MRAFVVLGLVFFHTKPRHWLVETSPKWPTLCRVGRKTATQSISQSALSRYSTPVFVVVSSRGASRLNATCERSWSCKVVLIASLGICYCPVCVCLSLYLGWLVGVEFNAPLDTIYRSFRRRSSQPITWLILTNKTVQVNTDKQTQYKSEKVNNLKYS